jgi:2-polyprenyl-3-methyl-5-hydroxy-6-metoxy-1,4-benzoquinol methylase
MDKSQLKKTEKETLATFKRHRPSEYFSHKNSSDYFVDHDRRVEKLYRFGLTFPPEFFSGRSLIDLGAGTGEHTVSLARWGARCTLVEMNSDAIEVAKKVFASLTDNLGQHEFINSSLFDLDLNQLRGQFDIAHSRGVFTHVADKRLAFKILSGLVKRGGYIIYGDRNTAGGLQEMLQRYAIYKLGGNSDQDIVETAEALFSKDIDRSQLAVPRTREAIIFDRWVIQQQDDPSVSEVLNFFDSEGIEFVSSWPRIDFLGRGSSTFSDPVNANLLSRGACLVESLWMILNAGEEENLLSFESLGSPEFFSSISHLSLLLRNLRIDSPLNPQLLSQSVNSVRIALTEDLRAEQLSFRFRKFFEEVSVFLTMVDSGESLHSIRDTIDSFYVLFQGFSGVRHVDYVGYKRL